MTGQGKPGSSNDYVGFQVDLWVPFLHREIFDRDILLSFIVIAQHSHGMTKAQANESRVGK